MMLTIPIVWLGAYLIGSLNSARIVCAAFQLPSPTTIGSGNPGTTNVLRLGGKVPALITLIGDVLKGVIPPVIAYSLSLNLCSVTIAAFLAVFGHMYPIFYRFQGGKGIATFIGSLFAIALWIGILFVVTWLLVALIWRYSSLAALCATAMVAFAVSIVWLNVSAVPITLAAVLIFWRHRGNIQRLFTGQEDQIGQSRKG